jgi:hypothetical protein
MPGNPLLSCEYRDRPPSSRADCKFAKVATPHVNSASYQGSQYSSAPTGGNSWRGAENSELLSTSASQDVYS